MYCAVPSFDHQVAINLISVQFKMKLSDTFTVTVVPDCI